MDIVAIMNEVHQTAVEHGWWDNERDPREAIALMHSELSEALEEARQGRPMYYSNPDNPTKPEGIGIELIDCVIRMLDFMGHYDIPYVSKSQRPVYITTEEPLPILICKLHAIISGVFGLPMSDSADVGVNVEDGYVCGTYEAGWCFSNAIDMIFKWLRANGASPEAFLKEKAEFNKSRPYKHGKAF